MLKRQDTFLSSSRRETPPPHNQKHNHAKSVGCMSGIFHLLSKYQHRHRRKFLTFGKKHDDKVAEYPSSTKRDRTNNRMLTKKEDQSRDCHVLSHLDVVRRNPAIEPEIRRSPSSESPKVDFRSSAALVPRLMGLHELEDPYPEPREHKSSISWEERRKLMSDLEKCDEDLKELKRIIESVRNSECVPSVVVRRAVVIEKMNTITSDQQPSPVSVLDDFTPSPLISATYSKRENTKYGRTPMPQLQKAGPKKKPGEDEVLESVFIHNITIDSVEAKREAASLSRPWSSKAMIESVEEVCKDIGSGEKREVARIGLVMQDYICTDLIEEIVKDLSGHSNYGNMVCALPFQACRRKLCF